MSNYWKSLLGAALALLSTHCGSSDDAIEAADSTTGKKLVACADPLTSEVLSTPRPVAATDHQWHLVYELILQNPGSTPVRILGLDVSDSERDSPLATYRGDGLEAIIEIAGESSGSIIEPGGSANVFVDLTGPLATRRARTALPGGLKHQLIVEREGVVREVSGPTTPVANARALLLEPPLHGSGLVALGCCDGSHRAILSLQGDIFYAQRFATDFLQVEGESTYRGDPSDNTSYFIFGDDVMAAESGTIVELRDGVAENVPTEPLPPADIDSAPGNYIVQAFDTGEFALYAHFRQGSTSVGVGDRVTRGQVLGQVGNTGNSTEPHLHFHVMDRASPLAADGLPYRFNRFRLEATVDVDADEIEITPVPPPNRRFGLLPLSGNIVAFR